MAKRGKRTRSKVMLAFGDIHIPHQNPRAVEVFCRVAEHIKPDLIVCLGDLLDCGQFSSSIYPTPKTENNPRPL